MATLSKALVSYQFDRQQDSIDILIGPEGDGLIRRRKFKECSGLISSLWEIPLRAETAANFGIGCCTTSILSNNFSSMAEFSGEQKLRIVLESILRNVPKGSSVRSTKLRNLNLINGIIN